MSSLKETEAKVARDIGDLTHDVIDQLTQIWVKTFETDICTNNIKKLTEHVTTFYEEIIVETNERHEAIVKKIQKLKEEAEMLQHLLKVDINLNLPKNVPLFTLQMRLDESLNNLRERLTKRKNHIYQLLTEQEMLCDELDETPRALLDDPLPTEEELEDFRLHLDALIAEKNSRIYKISTFRRDIKNFIQELEVSLHTEEEEFLLNAVQVPLSKKILHQLKSLHSNYVNQMEENRESLENMKVKIKSLWECLDVSPSVRNKFAKYTNYSQTTYDRFYRELQRCEDIKKQNIKKFIDKLRDEIVIWWDKSLKSDVERARFTNFTNDCYTEDLLALHEMELEDLKRFYLSNEKIFDLIAERKILWDRMNALEAQASEPGRFNNRGGKLLREEKERKTISTKLPKIEEELTELVNIYEENNNRKFTIFGQPILEIISFEWDKKRTEKEKLMSARKNFGATPTSKNNITRTPMSMRNVSSVKKIPSSANVSNMPGSSKRKLPLSSTLQPSAKRCLWTQLNSPNTRLKPTASAIKTPNKKMRVLASTITKRKSGRLSASAKKRRSKTTPIKKPKICVNEETITSDTCYDIFEECIGKDPNSRSSIMDENNITKAMRKRKNNVIETKSRLQSKHNVFDEVSNMKKSSSLATLSRTMSPARSTSSRKLTTKNLPIII